MSYDLTYIGMAQFKTFTRFRLVEDPEQPVVEEVSPILECSEGDFSSFRPASESDISTVLS